MRHTVLHAWEASQSLLWTHQSIRISQLISPVYSIHARGRQINRITSNGTIRQQLGWVESCKLQAARKDY